MILDDSLLSEKDAIICSDGTNMSYQKLQAEILYLYRKIQSRCLVFSLCTNSIGSVVGYLAFIEHGVVPAMLSATLERDLLVNLLEKYQPAYIWLPVSSKDEEVFVDMECVYEKFEYALLKTGYDRPYLIHDDLALLLTTSGSTGSPKFVRQTYDNIKVNTEQIIEYLRLDDTERAITTLPMNYTYGLSIINTHLMVGATILLTDESLMSRNFWTFMKEQKATSIAGVPYTYEMLDKLRFFRMDLPELRYMTQAGGKLSPELHKKFAQYAVDNNKRFIVMYGACEATARMGYLPADKSIEKYGSCGVAIPRGKFYLIDGDDNIIDDVETVGELVYEGPNVTMGYAECGEDLIKGDERHGRLATGDMAKRDKDGFYYIVGRKKRFLKIYGNRVNLDEIDRMIKAEFNFIECASAGVDDHMYIFVTDKNVVDEVRRFISDKTRLNSVAFKVIKIDEIPKNDAGKTLYRELEKYYI